MPDIFLMSEIRISECPDCGQSWLSNVRVLKFHWTENVWNPNVRDPHNAEIGTLLVFRFQTLRLCDHVWNPNKTNCPRSEHTKLGCFGNLGIQAVRISDSVWNWGCLGMGLNWAVSDIHCTYLCLSIWLPENAYRSLLLQFHHIMVSELFNYLSLS